MLSMRYLKHTIFLLIFTSLIWLFPKTTYSAACEDSCDDKNGEEKLNCLTEVKKACEEKLEETGKKKQTLKSTISYLNNQVALTQSKINETVFQIEVLSNEIDELTGKIAILTNSLDETTQVLISRIQETYKQSNTHPLILFFSSKGFSDFVNKLTYLRSLQQNDRQVMFELEKTRSNFDLQKTLKQEKQEEVLGLQTELVAQKSTLSQQKATKAKLLEQTNNDEKKYQQLLAVARAEFEAIQNVLAGGGNETEVGDVSEGQQIATIIPTSSCNSDGPHLHFTITKGDSIENPFSYLKSTDHKNCSGSSCDSSDGDSFNPSGDWNWPIDSQVQYTQGYGETWAVRNTWVGSIYSFHNGLDIYNQSLNVKAIKEGKLYRGSYVGATGCTLRYIKVDHKDSDLESYYLHVNYI